MGLGIPGWRPFAAAATAAASVSIVFVLWTANRWVSDQATIGLDDIGEAVAAFIAAGSCAFAAVRSGGRVRVAWTLFSLSALSWALGEVVWSWIEVVQGQAVPFPSAADAGYLLAIPLAIAGVFAFTSSPRRLATRGEAVLAGAIVALSLLFLAWGFGLAKVYETSSATPAAQLIGLAYPLGDIITATVLVLALRWGWRPGVVRLALLLGGLASLAAAVMAVRLAVIDQNLDRFATVLAGGIGILFVANQIFTHRDSLDLLHKSRSAENQLGRRTDLLDQIIAHAPLGIARVGPD